jgi:GNAT superfamily N-acetyltransferase
MLYIKKMEYSEAFRNKSLMLSLRKLTLNQYSGLNKEMNNLESLLRDGRKIDAKVLLAYKDDRLVGWALMSREESAWHYAFYNGKGVACQKRFNAGHGILFEIFVHPDYRRQGIASRIIKKAKLIANGTRLCVIPWNDVSLDFYKNFKEIGVKSIGSYRL